MTISLLSLYSHLLFRCLQSLYGKKICADGNPVQIGSGPAAVIHAFSNVKKKSFFSLYMSLVITGTGKAAGREGESENLPEYCGGNLVDRELPKDLRIKGISPGRIYFGPGIFIFPAGFLDFDKEN